MLRMLSTLQNTLKKLITTRGFDSRFSDFSEEDRMLAFINPFSLNTTICDA